MAYELQVQRTFLGGCKAPMQIENTDHAAHGMTDENNVLQL